MEINYGREKDKELDGKQGDYNSQSNSNSNEKLITRKPKPMSEDMFYHSFMRG